jgi:hypothetical protein
MMTSEQRVRLEAVADALVEILGTNPEQDHVMILSGDGFVFVRLVHAERLVAAIRGLSDAERAVFRGGS